MPVITHSFFTGVLTFYHKFIWLHILTVKLYLNQKCVRVIPTCLEELRQLGFSFLVLVHLNNLRADLALPGFGTRGDDPSQPLVNCCLAYPQFSRLWLWSRRAISKRDPITTPCQPGSGFNSARCGNYALFGNLFALDTVSLGIGQGILTQTWAPRLIGRCFGEGRIGSLDRFGLKYLHLNIILQKNLILVSNLLTYPNY